jgi:hypothetical protein
MAYDLVVGKTFKVKDSPDIVVSLEFADIKWITSLASRVDSVFLRTVSNMFEDATFSPADVKVAIAELSPLLLVKLGAAERKMLCELLAALNYANSKEMSLFGVAD